MIIGGWRVFLSHASELRDYPRGASYVAAAERAVSATGHVIVDMADFPAADLPAAQVCVGPGTRVRGVRGGAGHPLRLPGTGHAEGDVQSRSSTHFTEAGLPRLVFLLDTDADDVGIRRRS